LIPLKRQILQHPIDILDDPLFGKYPMVPHLHTHYG